MPVFRFGLSLAAFGFLYVSWASWSAGYWPEVALLRGLIAFMAVSLLAYAGELIVATAPPPVVQQAEHAQPAAERAPPQAERARPTVERAQPSAESQAPTRLRPNVAAADTDEERSDPALETGEQEQLRAA